MPGRDTQTYNILSLIAISGELPTNQVNRLLGGSRYKREIIKKLKRFKLVYSYYKDSIRGLRLSAIAKRKLIAENPHRFSFFLSGHSDTNKPKSEITRRIRLHRISQTYITMQNASVRIYRDAKPDIFSPKGSNTDQITVPVFYNSREIKTLGIQFAKIKGSRAVGTLLNTNNIFIVYNTGNSLMKWDYKSEMRTKALLEIVLCQQRLSEQYKPEDICGLIMGDDMETAYMLLTSTGGIKHNYFLLDGNFESFLYLTNDQYGEIILRILCNDQILEELNRILSEGLLNKNFGSLIEHDALDLYGNPVLFGYTCDLPKIKRFDTALSLQNKIGTLICFDFQFEVMRRYCSENVQLKIIDFNKCERRLFDNI